MNRFYPLVLIVISLFISFNISAQISYGGEPYTLNHAVELPDFVQPNPYELQYKASSNSKDCSALEFGRFLTIHKDINDEDWQIIETNEDFTVYRLAVYSPEALAVGVYFSDFKLPIGAKLFVYAPDYQQIKGAFTENNNRASALFAVEYVLGDRSDISNSVTWLPNLANVWANSTPMGPPPMIPSRPGNSVNENTLSLVR